MRFPNNKMNKMKAFTLSYDDGVGQDRRLVRILNKYNLKCTFKLNSGIQSNSNKFDINGLTSIVGMAYPYGVYDDKVIKVLRENGIKYARTVHETENFKLQSNLLEFM